MFAVSPPLRQGDAEEEASRQAGLSSQCQMASSEEVQKYRSHLPKTWSSRLLQSLLFTVKPNLNG